MKKHPDRLIKNTIHFLLFGFLLIVGWCLVSCDGDSPSAPAASPAQITKDTVWQVGDDPNDTYETLEEAIGSTKGTKDVDYTTIKLLKTATGSGATISEGAFEIDFNGKSFTFSGDTGLAVSGAAEVKLTNSSTESESLVKLQKTDAELVLIDVDGAEVFIDGFTNLTGGTDQYVIRADNGATVTAGGSADSDLVKLNGKLASKNASSDKATDIVLTNKTTADLSGIDFDYADGRVAKVTIQTTKDGERGSVIIKAVKDADQGTGDSKVHVLSTVANTVVVSPGILQEYFKITNPTAVSFNDYTIEYNLNGGSWGSYSPPDSYLDGSSTPTPLPTQTNISRSNYSFAGWFTDSSFTGEQITQIDAGDQGDKEFWAKWIYTVTYNSNGATGGTVPDAQENLIAGRDVNLAANSGDLVKTTEYEGDHTFLGWNTANDGSGNHYDAGAAKEEGFDGNTTLYAQWRKNPTVTLTAGTGISSVSGGGQYAPGTLVDTNAEVSTGYTWSKWTQTSGGAVVSTDKAYSFTMEGFDNVSYTANATPNNYTVTFYRNYNTDDSTTYVQSQTYDSKYVLPAEPTRENYTFAGWFTEKSGGVQITDKDLVNITAEQNLYAHWILETVEVTFNVNDGNGTNYEQVLPRGSRASIDPLANMSIDAPENKVFAGWTTNADGSGDYYEDNEEVIFSVAAVTLYAQWGLDLNDDTVVANKAAWINNTYVLTGDLTLENDRIYTSGSVKLFLLKDATLTASKGIGVHSGTSLTIHGKGTLTANASAYGNAGIGGTNAQSNCGDITINGGKIDATGAAKGAGIGGAIGPLYGTEQNVTVSHTYNIKIYGGEVKATGSERAAGIGGGPYTSSKPIVTIYGGKITAIGGKAGSFSGAAIGSGDHAVGAEITMYGGDITAEKPLNTDADAIGSGTAPLINPSGNKGIQINDYRN